MNSGTDVTFIAYLRRYTKVGHCFTANLFPLACPAKLKVPLILEEENVSSEYAMKHGKTLNWHINVSQLFLWKSGNLQVQFLSMFPAGQNNQRRTYMYTCTMITNAFIGMVVCMKQNSSKQSLFFWGLVQQKRHFMTIYCTWKFYLTLSTFFPKSSRKGWSGLVKSSLKGIPFERS